MECVGIFYDHLEYFMAIWMNLWPGGIVCGHFGEFFPILVRLYQKNLATLDDSLNLKTPDCNGF
jgi:hypothetical protein